MKQSRTVDTAGIQLGNQGFTKWELFILIVGIICMFLVLLPTVKPTGRKAPRVECLCNQNGIWKATSQWGMDPRGTWRPTFPNGNLAAALALENIGITPEIFICPGGEGRTGVLGIHIQGKNKEWGISAATNMASIQANNCNYAYFGGREAENLDLVLIADKNGSNNPPSATAWGGNHDGKGGNLIQVNGHGFWVSSLLESKSALYCITNADVAAAFATNGTVYAY